ncbi:MAG TPA: twin-arginine translocation signal domain-containing protein, partial [Planctomycetes bacterium]|nr:twin-arginine translocation signal domain-containing protein [Planctomycetota bacterium]
MLDRRTALKGVTLGAGAVALSPFLKHLDMLQAAEGQQLPKRLVFVVKSSGLQGEFLNPEGLKHGGDTLVDEPLQGKVLPESLKSLEPFKNKLTIIQGLSGRMTLAGHSAFYGALGGYKAAPHTPPLFATVDGHLSEKLPSVFNHVGF